MQTDPVVADLKVDLTVDGLWADLRVGGYSHVGPNNRLFLEIDDNLLKIGVVALFSTRLLPFALLSEARRIVIESHAHGAAGAWRAQRIHLPRTVFGGPFADGSDEDDTRCLPLSDRGRISLCRPFDVIQGGVSEFLGLGSRGQPRNDEAKQHERKTRTKYRHGNEALIRERTYLETGTRFLLLQRLFGKSLQAAE